MGTVLALFRAGVRRQASYRLALVSGLLTNVFFGVVRTALFVALYRNASDVGGFDEADALTYVWVLQALFGAIWTPWLFELPDRIRSGDFVSELTRPGDPLVRHFAFDLGRISYFLALACPGAALRRRHRPRSQPADLGAGVGRIRRCRSALRRSLRPSSGS